MCLIIGSQIFIKGIYSRQLRIKGAIACMDCPKGKR